MFGWLKSLYDRIGAPAGASVSADVAAAKADTAAILTDTADMQPKLGTPAANVSADILAVKTDTAAVLVDTADMQPKLGIPAADVSADIAAVKVDSGNLVARLGTPAAGTVAGDVESVETKVDTVDGIVDDIKAGGGFGSAVVRKSITFAGATPNAIGDFDGTGNPADIFTVTGQVITRIVAVCTTSIAFDVNATIAVGISGAASTIIATTDLTVQGLIAREIWHDATPDAEIEAMSVMKDFIITDGNDIILTCGVANTNTGVIEFYCLYTALSSDGAVVAA